MRGIETSADKEIRELYTIIKFSIEPLKEENAEHGLSSYGNIYFSPLCKSKSYELGSNARLAYKLRRNSMDFCR